MFASYYFDHQDFFSGSQGPFFSHQLFGAMCRDMTPIAIGKKKRYYGWRMVRGLRGGVSISRLFDGKIPVHTVVLGLKGGRGDVGG